jgi:hypothetical protein
MIDEEERKIPDEFIETIDVWALRSLRLPVMRVLSRHFVEERELRRYERGLLATGRWTLVRVAPHQSDAGTASTHIFDVYGQRRLNSTQLETSRRPTRGGDKRSTRKPQATGDHASD